MGQKDLKQIRQELTALRFELESKVLSEEERKNLENLIKEVRKNYALALIGIKKGEIKNEKHQGR